MKVVVSTEGHKGWGDDPVATIEGDEVYEGHKGWGDDPIATIEGDEVYEGHKGWGDDPIATIEEGGRMSAAAAAVYLLLI